MSEVFSKEESDRFFSLRKKGWRECTYRELSWARKLLLRIVEAKAVHRFYGSEEALTWAFPLDFASLDNLVRDARETFQRKVKLV